MRTDIGDSLTSSTPLLDFDLQTALVDQVQGLGGVPILYYTGDVHFTRTLTNHLDVYAPLCE
jgi:hypothetical protein